MKQAERRRLRGSANSRSPPTSYFTKNVIIAVSGASDSKDAGTRDDAAVTKEMEDDAVSVITAIYVELGVNPPEIPRGDRALPPSDELSRNNGVGDSDQEIIAVGTVERVQSGGGVIGSVNGGDHLISASSGPTPDASPAVAMSKRGVEGEVEPPDAKYLAVEDSPSTDDRRCRNECVSEMISACEGGWSRPGGPSTARNNASLSVAQGATESDGAVTPAQSTLVRDESGGGARASTIGAAGSRPLLPPSLSPALPAGSSQAAEDKKRKRSNACDDAPVCSDVSVPGNGSLSWDVESIPDMADTTSTSTSGKDVSLSTSSAYGVASPNHARATTGAAAVAGDMGAVPRVKAAGKRPRSPGSPRVEKRTRPSSPMAPSASSMLALTPQNGPSAPARGGQLERCAGAVMVDAAVGGMNLEAARPGVIVWAPREDGEFRSLVLQAA